MVLGERRRRDLARIRQIFIPEFILRLHYCLYKSRRHIPEYVLDPSYEAQLMSSARRNLKHCLSLANMVADSRYKLYDDFSNQEGRRLGDYLQSVKQAVLAGLEGGGSDPFWIISSA